MADTTSIFYKIGQATKSSVDSALAALKAANNTFTGTNDFNKAVTVGTDGVSANLTVKGDVSSVKVTASGAVSGSSVSATGAVSGGSASITNAVSAGSVSATGSVSSATLSTTGNATIGGDLTVSGTTTTISTNNLDVKDNIITLNDGAKAVSTTAPDSGLLLERSSGTDNAAILFQETDSRFEVGTTSATGGTASFGAVTLGALAVNSLLVGTRDATQALGDLADFNAGLIA